MMKKDNGSVGSLKAPKKAVGNQEVTHRGYKGGSATSSERPGEKKLNSPVS